MKVAPSGRLLLVFVPGEVGPHADERIILGRFDRLKIVPGAKWPAKGLASSD
jgi:hypothetical protein